jgi:plastocyanin
MKSIMKSKRHLVVAALILFIGAGSFIFAYSYGSNKTGVAVADKCDGTCIELNQDKASPDTISVPIGSFVQFNSADGKSHSLSLGDGGSEHSHKGTFSSGTFKADEGWRVQFKEEGSYLFHDHLNPKISVLVVVYTPGKDYKIER